jgi:predicted Zn-dependent peptidase
LAHLFEHLAFKGTSKIGTRDPELEAEILDDLDRVARELVRELNRGREADGTRIDALRTEIGALQERHRALVVKDELSQILTGNGARGLNASTSKDLTSYYVSLPANRLELWCLLESARLRDPVLREFYSERDVVKEERRFRIENNPGGKLYEQLLLTAFQTHPYRVAGAGWMSDLDRLTRPDAEAFRSRHYVPNNAVGALVGDVDPDVAERLLRRYFNDIPAGPDSPAPVIVEPRQRGERRITVEFDAEPEVTIAFHKPNAPHPDDPVFDIIESLLSSGRSSRLFRALVTESKVALGIAAFEAPGERYPNLFVVGGEPRAPHTATDLTEAILAELDRLAREPVPERELLKIHNQVEAKALYALRSNAGLASRLSYFEILSGDWRELIRRQDALEAVTAERVQEVARRTFTAANRTIAVRQRASRQEDPPGSPGGGLQEVAQ